MPRQAANGEAQDTPFVRHVRFCQPVDQNAFARTNLLFQRLRHTSGTRNTCPPQRPRWMQIENRQARITALGLASSKEATAIGKGQQIPEQRLIPSAGGYSLGQHLIE